MADERKRLTESGRHVYEAALGEPYDEARLRDAVAIFQIRERRLQETAEDILISHLGSMPPEARATAAAGLLTPFNARMQRADEQARIAAHESGDALDRRGGARAGIAAGHAAVEARLISRNSRRLPVRVRVPARRLCRRT